MSIRRANRSTTVRRREPTRVRAREEAAKPKDVDPEWAKDWQSALGKSSGKSAQQKLVARWAAHFKTSPVPEVGERGTVGGFVPAQLKVIHELFWSAPPGADEQEIARLCSQHKAFKGDDFKPESLRALVRYRPESFPFSWADRKRSICSFVTIEAMRQTPSDVTAEKVFEALKVTHEDFLGDLALKRMAAKQWMQKPELFPFANQMPLRKDKKGYRIDTLGEVTGLPRFRGRLALSEQLRDKVVECTAHPSLVYGTTFDAFLNLISEEIGEPFSSVKWRKLRESFPEMPTWFDVERTMRTRVAERVAELVKGGVTEAKDLVAVLQEEGASTMDVTRLVNMRAEFPEHIPRFKQDRLARLNATADRFLELVVERPDASFVEIGAELSVPPHQVDLVTRIIRLRDPALLPTRKDINPYSKAELKMLEDAIDALPAGAGLAELYETLESLSPEFFERHPIEDPKSLGKVVNQKLGLSWKDIGREAFLRDFADAAKDAGPGVTLVELHAQLRAAYDCRFSYTYVKQTVRAAVKEDHPKMRALQNDAGRYPWEIGFDLDEALAKTVGAMIKAHPEDGLREIVGRLMKDKVFRDNRPTFGPLHVQKLRTKFPRLLPYLSDLDHSAAGREARSAKKLAQKAEKAAAKLGHDGLTIAALARELGVGSHNLHHAVVSFPERFPWYRKAPWGHVNLELAYHVANAMEEAPLGHTLDDVAKRLNNDAKFRERFPAFSKQTVSSLRELFPDVVPSWQNRDQVLRVETVIDALLHAKKGASFADVKAQLIKAHPGFFHAAYGDPEFLKAKMVDVERFPRAAELMKEGEIVLEGKGLARGEETPSQLATRAARLSQIPDELDLVSLVASFAKDKPLSSGQRYEFVCVQHLLDSQVPVYDALKDLGMAPSRTTLLGVPYSASPLVVDVLRDRGWDVRVPTLDMETWTEDIRTALYERLESAKKSHRDIVVMDDGGLVAKLVSTDPVLKAHQKKFKIVEQTRRGITVADKMADAHGAVAPIMNVAQSWGKFVEGPMIGSDVEEKLVERLEKAGIVELKGKKPLKGKTVGVIGAGTIGLPIAEQMRELGAEVVVLDISADAQKRAKKAGFRVADPEKRAAFFGDKDIIVGATGVRSMSEEDFAHLKDGCTLASASSKLVEIDVAALKEAREDPSAPLDLIDDDTHPPSVTYPFADGRKINLLARGFPVNFDGAQENIAPEHIQLTRALMVIGVLQATQAKVPGVKRLDVELQKAVLERFKETHYESASDELKAALDEGLSALKKGTSRR